MLRMPEFEVHRPTSAADAIRLRTTLPASMYVAGGTDLLPNLKHQLHAPQHLVSLSDVRELVGVDLRGDGTLSIGAATSLHDVATSEVVRREAPGLAQAAGLVAGPQHRRMGTIGGNVMLDTRCLFYNQTEHWRKSLGYCLKKDGSWCHVVGSDKLCVAAQSSDTVPMLIALGATLVVEDAGGRRTISLEPLYQQDGRYERMHALGAEALVCAIVVPPRGSGHRSVYRKVRARGAVDFPQLGLGVVGAFDGDVVTALVACLGALMPKPRLVRGLGDAVGRRLDDPLIEKLAEEAGKQAHAQKSVHGDPAWRKHMAKVEMRRALQSLRDAGSSAV